MTRRTLLTLSALAAMRPAFSEEPPPDAAPPKPDAAKSAKPVVMPLSNGLRLVVVPDPDATVIAVDVFFLVGLADEKGLPRTNALPGMNALIARTWGGESENRIAALLRGDVARIGSIGTDFSEDWVELWGLSAPDPDEFGGLLQTMLTNLVANPLFSMETVVRAREEQRQDIALSRDDPLADTIDRLRGRIFANSPYGLPLYGGEAGLSALTPERITAYYHRYFRPQRCIITVAGPVTPEDARHRVVNSLGAGGWDTRPPAPPLPLTTAERIPMSLKDLILPRRVPGSIVALGYIAPGTATVASRIDHAALLLLDAVLGGGKAARLFANLRDAHTGQAPVGYDARTQVFAGRGQSLWVAYITGGREPLDCRNALQNELDALASGERPITPDEYERAKTYLIARHLRERQRTRFQAFGAGWSETMGLGADFDTDFAARLDSINADALNGFARRILSAPSAAAYVPHS